MNNAALAPAHPLEKWLTDRRKTLEEWKRTPPYGLGLLVLLLVSLEMAVAYRLTHHIGFDTSLISSVFKTALYFLAFEVSIFLISNSFASIFDKKARMIPVLVSLNIALLPLLLYLPITLYIWASGASSGLRVMALLLLMLKVLADWKDVIRTNYRLTGIQTYMLGGVVGGIAYVVLIFFLILSGFSAIVRLISF